MSNPATIWRIEKSGLTLRDWAVSPWNKTRTCAKIKDGPKVASNEPMALNINASSERICAMPVEANIRTHCVLSIENIRERGVPHG